MASIEIDIELDNFSDDELLEEVSCRLNSMLASNRTDRTRKKLDLLRDQIKELYEELFPFSADILDELEYRNTSLLEQLKIEHLMKAAEKYTLEEVENLIPI